MARVQTRARSRCATFPLGEVIVHERGQEDTSLSRLIVVKVQERRRVVTASSPPSPAMRSVSLSAIRSPLCVSSTHDVNQLVHRWTTLLTVDNAPPASDSGNRCALRSAKTTVMATGDGLAVSRRRCCRLHDRADRADLLRPSGISLGRLALSLHSVIGAPNGLKGGVPVSLS